MLDRMVWYFK